MIKSTLNVVFFTYCSNLASFYFENNLKTFSKNQKFIYKDEFCLKLKKKKISLGLIPCLSFFCFSFKYKPPVNSM